MHIVTPQMITIYAELMCDIVADWVPAAYGAFADYRMGGGQLSARGLDCVRRMIKGEAVDQESSGMSAGEWREFRAMIDG